MTNIKLDKVHPELRQALEGFGGFTITRELLPAIREFSAKPPLPSPFYKDVLISRDGAEAPLRCVLIDPIPESENRPLMLYMHGGGFVFGSPEVSLPTLQKLAQDVGCLILIPDYRLAPEYPFPAALEDGKRALVWLHDNAIDLRLDKTKLVIGGDSAGGGHAVVLTASLGADAPFRPSFLFLAYPMLDNDTGVDEDHNGGTAVWTALNNRFGWQAYLGESNITEKISAGAVPSKIENLGHFPPTFLATGTLDLFFEENLAFVEKLKSQGVIVQSREFIGAYHAFDVIVPDAKISEEFRKAGIAALKTHFRN